jgi:hypothetical protein
VHQKQVLALTPPGDHAGTVLARVYEAGLGAEKVEVNGSHRGTFLRKKWGVYRRQQKAYTAPALKFNRKSIDLREGAGYSRIAEEGPAISGRRTCLPWDTIPESQCFHY